MYQVPSSGHRMWTSVSFKLLFTSRSLSSLYTRRMPLTRVESSGSSKSEGGGGMVVRRHSRGTASERARAARVGVTCERGTPHRRRRTTCASCWQTAALACWPWCCRPGSCCCSRLLRREVHTQPRPSRYCSDLRCRLRQQCLRPLQGSAGVLCSGSVTAPLLDQLRAGACGENTI
jgi:hypothetical protein